jgi:hypothetical protein
MLARSKNSELKAGQLFGNFEQFKRKPYWPEIVVAIKDGLIINRMDKIS